jgi:hypothetical protein
MDSRSCREAFNICLSSFEARVVSFDSEVCDNCKNYED